MTLYSLLVFLPGMLSGGMILHWFWPERGFFALLLKTSLGIGLGMGTSSILYFLGLSIAPGKINILPVMLALLIGLLIVTFLRERRPQLVLPPLPRLTLLQWGLTAAAALALTFMLLAFFNLIRGLPQGAFDAWAIWDRAARFIYRDPAHWRATLSPELYWANHADYPLLVPLNIAWGWQALGEETVRTPAVQVLLFMLAGVGLIFSSVGLTRSIGQASLGVMLLSGSPFIALTASGLLSDVPIMYFISAALILMYLALTRREGTLMVLSGFMAGLAAWTKNEGLLFILAALLGLALTRYRDMKRSVVLYAGGLAIPLAVVLYFKSLAPPSDLFAAGIASSLAYLQDPTRYWIILKALANVALKFGGWPFSLPAGLALYYLAVRAAPPPGSGRGLFTIGAIIILQFLGYCAIYLLSPYDLEWHLTTSLARVLLQIFPASLFVYLLMVREPERIFGRT